MFGFVGDLLAAPFNVIAAPFNAMADTFDGGGGGCGCSGGGGDGGGSSGPLSPEFEAAYDNAVKSIENMPAYIQNGMDSINRYGSYGTFGSLG